MKLLTDYFQAAELVAAGVPMDTADYFFHKDCIYTSKEKRYEPTFPYTPCWSVSALWEVLRETDTVFEFSTELSSSELVEALVNAIKIAYERV